MVLENFRTFALELQGMGSHFLMGHVTPPRTWIGSNTDLQIYRGMLSE